MDTKNCKQCNKEFTKPYNESKKSWSLRVFCSRKCVYSSDEIKNKIALSNTGKSKNLGHNVSEETRLKISQANKGKKRTDEQKKRIGDSGKGRPAWNKGKKCEWVAKRNKDNPMKKEKHPNWKGGKSFELYGFEWTDLLKHSIRTRDCFVCYMCKKNGYDVHHIDYNKKNCNPNNLITLCRSCHIKTNHKREYWVEYFQSLPTRYLSLS